VGDAEHGAAAVLAAGEGRQPLVSFGAAVPTARRRRLGERNRTHRRRAPGICRRRLTRTMARAAGRRLFS